MGKGRSPRDGRLGNYQAKSHPEGPRRCSLKLHRVPCTSLAACRGGESTERPRPFSLFLAPTRLTCIEGIEVQR